ncbi:MAG: MMPL family transporter [Thermomicrobiales bacterium]
MLAMLARWGYALYRFRKPVLALSGLGMILSLVVLATVAPDLSSEGFVDDEAESSRVDRMLAEEFGRGDESLVFILDADQPVADPATRSAVEAALAPAVADERVTRVLTTWNTGNPAFVSHDGQSTYAVAILAPGTDDEEALDDLRDAVGGSAAAAGFEMSVGGFPAIGEAIAEEVEEGIARAEIFSVPLTLLIQIVIFGGLVAAGVPLIVGGLAIAGAVAAVFALSGGSFQSVFAPNVILMLGLGLGVDYSLFMVTRFREEIRTKPVDEALSISMATIGKAIFFSGVTVIFGLAATYFFPLPALRSMGQAGMLVVALSMVYGLTFLPALLGVLGPRINAVSIRRRATGDRRQETERSAGHSALGTGHSTAGFWHGLAEMVMRRPVVVLAAVLLVLVIAGLPFSRLDLTPGGPEVLPLDNPARIANDRLQTDFPAGEAEPIPIIVRAEEGDILTGENVAGLQSFVERVAAVPNVTRVESIVTDPAARGVDWNAGTLPAELQPAIEQRVRGGATFVEVVADAEGADLEDVVRDVRALDTAGMSVLVGGFPGSAVDTVDGIADGVVPALIFVVVGSYLILLLTFGSVFLPLKAIFMTLLSISASLGTLVLIFQDGRLEGLLNFQASGEIISTTPILMFCILFGLSMDYEVLMLTRVQEEYQRTGDNRAAVALGLEKSGKVITGAAAIMIVVFGGFMLADVVIIKSMGFGLALAVLIDATIVRGLLVPATMRLMGRWNWWAPEPVRRIVTRLGLAHA